MEKYADWIPVIVVLVLGIINWIILLDEVAAFVGSNGQTSNTLLRT